MEYSSTIWDPHTTVNINRLESVQKHTASYSRFSSVKSKLADLNLPTLQEETKQNYKCYIFHQLV